MLKLFSKPKPVASQVTFTITSRLRVHTQELMQVQYATERYVATQFDRMLFLFWPEKGGRFLVDRVNRQLKRVDVSAQRAQMEQVRVALGNVLLEPDEAGVEIDGRPCRRVGFRNENAQLVVNGEVFYARVPGLERTALQQDRDFEASMQPVKLPLGADEVVVRSSMKLLAAQFEQSQTAELVSVQEEIAELESVDQLLTYPIVD